MWDAQDGGNGGKAALPQVPLTRTGVSLESLLLGTIMWPW